MTMILTNFSQILTYLNSIWINQHFLNYQYYHIIHAHIFNFCAVCTFERYTLTSLNQLLQSKLTFDVLVDKALENKNLKCHCWNNSVSAVFSWSRSVASDCLWPHGPTRLLHPLDFPGKNTGMGCHFLLQEIFPTQGLKLGLPHYGQTLYHLSHQGNPKIIFHLTLILKPDTIKHIWYDFINAECPEKTK